MREGEYRLAPKRSVADAIAILRRHFPGALLCSTCARIISSTPTGYAASKLTPEQIENYVCYGCHFDADPARSAEMTARFSASKAAAAAARLSAPLKGLSPCTCTASLTCASCLQTLTAEAVCGRRVAHDYFDVCATNGHHHDLDALADCPNPSATIASAAAPSVFCEHARPAEACAVHAKLGPSAPMPTALARCGSCGGWHGKNGRDRCPYGRQEAAAVKASRMPGAATYSKKPSVAEMGSHNPSNIKELQNTIPHLGNASKRLRRKPGRLATGTSKWAALRRNQRGCTV
jgi:hypothetical protein